MAKRPRRWLRRLVVAFLVLLVLLVGGFTWFAYWPLEGRAGRIQSLTPASVDFAVKGTWKEIRERGWVRQNVFEDPFLPALAEALDDLDEKTLSQVRRMEEQVNAAIPMGVTRFSVEDDVLGSEVVLAGRICRDWGPDRGPPWTKEFVALTRVTWKVRLALSALKHGFVRDMAGRQAGPIEEVGPGVYRIVLRDVAVSPVRNREGCEAGFVIPPENEVYLTRVRDVMAVGNSQDLVQSVADLGRTDDPEASFGERPGVRLDVPAGGVAAAVDMGALEKYLIRAIEKNPQAQLLHRFVSIPALMRLNGTLSFPSPDLVLGEAEIPYDASRLGRGVGDVYDLPTESLRSGLSTLVPAEDTFAVLLVSSPPLHLLRSFFDDLLSEGDRKLIRDNLRRNSTKYRESGIDALFEDIARYLGNRAAFAVGRLSTVFDKVEYPEWYSTDPARDPKPMPAFALMVPLRVGVNADEVDAFLAEQVPALGFRKEIARVEYKGLTYSRLEIEQKSADYALATPAYMLVKDHLVMAMNEDYFRRIVDTITGGPSLAADPTFQATMAALPEAAHFGLFVDLDKLYRVPADVEPAGRPRGFLWDRRRLWVLENRSASDAAAEYYRKLLGSRKVTEAESDEIDKAVAGYEEDWIRRYPEFLEEYRRELADHRRLRAFGIAFAATREALRGSAALLLKAPEAAAQEQP